MYIEFVFQFHHLLPEFTAIENVALPAMIAGNSRKQALETKNILGILNLSDRLEHKPSQLSGGEQQEKGCCPCLANKPSVVFADGFEILTHKMHKNCMLCLCR